MTFSVISRYNVFALATIWSVVVPPIALQHITIHYCHHRITGGSHRYVLSQKSKSMISYEVPDCGSGLYGCGFALTNYCQT